MLPKQSFHGWTLGLTVAGLLLPIALSVFAAVAALLVGMGDNSGGGVLYRIALAAGILWAIDLVCLLLLLAVKSLGEREKSRNEEVRMKNEK